MSVGGHLGFACGAGEQRRVDARLREDAGLMGFLRPARQRAADG